MGVDRIKKNLKLSEEDAVEFCKKVILDKNADITRSGKNYYIELNDMIITVNSYSFTIITAHKVRRKDV